MKWILELRDNPIDIKYPVEGMQIADNGSKRGPYFFSIDDTIAALKEFDPSESEYMPMPIPPKNTAFITSTKDMTQFKVIMDIPKAVQTIRYDAMGNQGVYFVGFPRTLCAIEVKQGYEGWKVTDSRLFAIEENTKLEAGTKLSHFPFPNVYKGSREGAICWGANVLPIFKEIRDLENIFQMFLQAPFNEDLGLRILAKQQGMTFHSYLEHLENDGEPKPFNDEDLIPCGMQFGGLMDIKTNNTMEEY